MTTAILFPGQGSQKIGMGQALAEAFPDAKAVFDEVDDALNQHLFKIICEGPEDQLTLTENTQPALMAVSMAVMRVLETQGGKTIDTLGSLAAGHSLGEYSAYAAAGSVSVADAARLLKIRGQAMQQAVPVGEGGMAAIIGVDIPTAEAIATEAAEGEACQVANDNSNGQVVISGTAGAIARGEAIAKEKGAKRYVPLPVSAPFHSTLMQPAAEAMEAALAEATIAAPAVPIIANIDVSPTSTPDDICSKLVAQVTGRVRWRETVEYLAEQGVTNTIEIGSGNVLTGLVKRTSKAIATQNIETVEDIEAFLNA